MARKVVVLGFLGVLMLVLAGCGAPAGSSATTAQPVAQPPRSAELPSNTVWDSTDGEWVLVENPAGAGGERSDATDPAGVEGETQTGENQWYEDHKKSTDEIDRAIVRYFENLDPAMRIGSFWDPEEDVVFRREMMSPEIRNLPEMLRRVQADGSSVSGRLMNAFALRAKIKDLVAYSVSEEDVARWFGTLKEKAVAARALASAAQSGSTQGMTAEESKKAVADLGVLALPYLQMEAETNASALDDLRALTGKDLKEPADASEDVERVKALLDTIISDH